jgi:hypothetical protein
LDKKKKRKEEVNMITQELKAIKEQYMKLEQRQTEIRNQIVFSMERNRAHASLCGSDYHWSHGGDQPKSHGGDQPKSHGGDQPKSHNVDQNMFYVGHRHGENT